MKVAGILEAKGHAVETTRPEATVGIAIRRLTTMGIGALVVSADGERVDGMISERDIVRGLNTHGQALLGMRVTDVMSHWVPVCSPNDSIKHVMAQMTQTRNRHLPVVDGGKLCGLVSIGDIVKHRLEEMELETNVLRDHYIARR
ncbi:MAG: CBS domain-containing protein [Egibacteraceae bacterium]